MAVGSCALRLYPQILSVALFLSLSLPFLITSYVWSSIPWEGSTSRVSRHGRKCQGLRLIATPGDPPAPAVQGGCPQGPTQRAACVFFFLVKNKLEHRDILIRH